MQQKQELEITFIVFGSTLGEFFRIPITHRVFDICLLLITEIIGVLPLYPLAQYLPTSIYANIKILLGCL